ncbi:DUF7288 family protein [Natronorubrum texcoconense]|nr:hypothetical protein [Natronorubrum texcoconense]
MRDNTTTDRGQAYTLEGFISAMIVLMALLFALQSIVITPTTGGLADRTVEAQMQQEAEDALVIAAEDGNLSEMIRHYDEENDEWPDTDSGDHYDGSDESVFYEFTLGEILSDRFTSSGQSYNVELVYWNESENAYESEDLVYQGESESVTASYTVTLFEDDELTYSENDDTELRNTSNYPVTALDDSSNVYNVVEVRVSVW